MYPVLLTIHSLLRYALVFTALYAIYRAFTGWQGKRPFTSEDNKAGVFLVIFMHSQLLIGLLLYFIFSPYAEMGFNMKDPQIRFWKVEHIAMMFIAIVLFQVGRIVSKKATSDLAKHKKATIYYSIAFVIMMASIPWPFSNIARPWLRF